MKVAFSLLICLILLLPASAQQASTFTAHFQTGAPVTKDSNVQVTLSFRLTNSTSDNVRGATVKLVSPIAIQPTYATFSEVNVAAGESIVLTQSVTVPQREFARWQQGSPALRLEYYNAEGQKVGKLISAKAVVNGGTL